MQHRSSLRKLLTTPLALLALLAAAASADRLPAVIVITEIMYHPEGDDRELEYIELHNETPDPMDLTGYFFTAGIDFTFTDRTFLDGGAYIVVCANKEKIQQKYQVQNLAGNWSAETSLDDAGEAIELANPAGVVEARVRYNDRGKWPSAADGTGHSLEIESPYSEMDDPDRWGYSARRGGSPGRANDTETGDISIDLNEALLTGNSGERWIELFNDEDVDVDVSGYHVTNDPAQLMRSTIPAGTVIPSRKFLVLKDTDLGLDLGAGAAARVFIAIVNPSGDRVMDARNFEPNTANPGLSEARIPDGDDFVNAADPTPGAPNKVTVNTDVVINEVMYHPLHRDTDNQNGLEYVELYNRGAQAVDLTGWSITDGINFQFPDGTMLPADGYLVVTRTPERLREVYGLAANAVLGPRADDPVAIDRFGTLADGGERITLTDPKGNTADTVRYYDGGEWPRWADGGGSSMELIEANQDNSIAQAWDSSDESGKSQPTLHEYRGILAGAFSAADPAEFHLVLTGPGITVVDDLKMSSRVVTLLAEQTFVKLDDTWRYFKGKTEASDPISAWTQPSFDDSSWPEGQAVIGFGDGDEKTVLPDMRKLDPEPGYACFYVRKAFDVADPASIKNLVLDVEYDDGYVAYLNGVEVASGNMRPGERSFDKLAITAKEKAKEQVDLTSRKDLIVPGKNLLAVQIHNSTLASNDARWAGQLASGTFQTEEGPNLFKDGAFETDAYKTAWTIQGTHVRSGRTAQAISGAGSLKIVSSGGGDNKVNRIETTNTGLTAPVTRVDYTISFLAKWITGTPTLLTHGSYQGSSPPSYASSTRLNVPLNLGTPGAINSATQRQVSRTGGKNMGPVIAKVKHTPPLPAASQAVTVEARVADPDGIESVTLHYSLDTPKPEGDAALLSIPMTYDEDEGVYTCEVPGQLAKKRVVYYITAKDSKGQSGRWPLDHVNRANPLLLDASAAGVNDWNYAVYRHDTPFNGKPQSMRFWMHQANENYLGSRPLHSNDLVDGTFLFQNKDVYYNSKIRFSGSPWARQAWSESYRIRMPKDNPLHGSIESFNLEDHQDGGARVGKERISHYLLRWHQGQSITPYSLQWYAQLQVNDRVNEVRELVQTPNAEFVSRWWPGDDDGSFFEMDDRHVFNDAGLRQDSLDGYLLYPPYGAATLGADKEQYRYYFSLRLNEEEDDFTHLVNLARLMTKSQTPDDVFDQLVWDEVDVESFLRYWSIRMNTDDWDCWGTNRGKNCYLYRPSEYGKWYLLAWDMELTYGNVGAFMPPTLTATSNPAYANKFSEVTRFINRPRIKRLYYGIMKEMIDNQFQSTFLVPFLLKLDAVGVTQTQIGKANGYIDQRRRSLQTAVKGVTVPTIDFTLTTNGGQPLEVESTDVLLEGRAPVEISMIRILVDRVEPVPAWTYTFSDTSVLGWSAQGTLSVGAHTIDFIGVNSLEEVVDTVSMSVTVVNPGPPTLTSVSPARVIPGETVALTGTRFKAGIKVLFGAVEATQITLTPGDTTTMTAVVPLELPLGVVDVRVQSAGGLQSEPFPITVVAEKRKFIRGDSDRSGKVDLTDAVFTLRYLFQGGEEPRCKDAADADDDGALSLTDAVAALRFLFQGGAAPPAPYPDPGEDPTSADPLDCALGLE